MSHRIRSQRAYPRDRQQPMLSFVEHDLQALCEEIRQEFCPRLLVAPRVCFLQQGGLASITQRHGRLSIQMHAILNSSETPRSVFTWILKHELLHTQIEAREVDGRWRAHPPEFYAEERRIAPERDEAYSWLFRELGDRLQKRPRLERIDVLPQRRRASAVQRHAAEAARVATRQ